MTVFAVGFGMAWPVIVSVVRRTGDGVGGRVWHGVAGAGADR